MDEDVRIASEQVAIGTRRYQLSPPPSDRWRAAFEQQLFDRLKEVVTIPLEVEIRLGSDPDDVVVTGLRAEDSEQVDRVIHRMVRSVSERFRKDAAVARHPARGSR